MSIVSFPESLGSLVGFLNDLEQRVPIEGLRQHLTQLNVTLEDLKPYLQFGDSCYRRNLICENEWYELLCICWKNGQESLIHNHASSTCGLRVISGSGTEITFVSQPDGQVTAVSKCVLKAGEVCCTQDADIHQVSNLQAGGESLVTLHIYSPPLRDMCTFERCDERCD